MNQTKEQIKRSLQYIMNYFVNLFVVMCSLSITVYYIFKTSGLEIPKMTAATSERIASITGIEYIVMMMAIATLTIMIPSDLALFHMQRIEDKHNQNKDDQDNSIYDFKSLLKWLFKKKEQGHKKDTV